MTEVLVFDLEPRHVYSEVLSRDQLYDTHMISCLLLLVTEWMFNVSSNPILPLCYSSFVVFVWLPHQ